MDAPVSLNDNTSIYLDSQFKCLEHYLTDGDGNKIVEFMLKKKSLLYFLSFYKNVKGMVQGKGECICLFIQSDIHSFVQQIVIDGQH